MSNSEPERGRSIWLLNHYALTPDLPGGTRHFDLAYELTQMGYHVTILASAFNHSLQEQVRLLGGEPWALEEMEGVSLIWLPSFPYRANNWRRVVNMLDFAWRAYRLGRRLPRLESRVAPPDVVIGCAVHLFAVLSGYYLARHHRAHFLMEVRDLWPQTFIDMGLWHEGQLRARFFRWLEQWVYQRAERILILSPQTKEYLAHYSTAWAAKAIYIPNGTRVARFEQVQSKCSGGRPLQMCFLGSMGYKNGIDLILLAMQIVEKEAPGLVRCALIGDGPEKAQFKQLARDLHLKAVQFREAVPRNQVPALAMRADILVLVERDVFFGSSNKLFDYMAAGKPIVSSVFAAHNNVVEQVGCGLAAAPGVASDLAAKILSMARLPEAERQAMGERGRAYVQAHHDYAVLAARLAAVLDELPDHADPETLL